MSMGMRDNICKRSESVKRASILRNMDQEYMDFLTPLLERYSCPSGVTVIQQGQPAEYLYIILGGKVQVNYKPYDGAPITVTHIGKDGLFGWSAVVGSRTYTSSVTAIEQLETYRIQGSELRKLCMEHPEAGKEILERLASVVSSRWKNSHEQVKTILINAMKN